jgi:hypothetical protein
VSKIDLNRVWDDARAMGAANKDLLAAIAGMFVLLPSVLAAIMMKVPEKVPEDLPPGDALQLMVQHYADNWFIFMPLSLIVSFSLLAMLVLLLRPERLTVAESLKAGLVLIPGYFIANFLQSIAFSVGLMLLVLPGLYILARFSLIAAVAAAEQCGNPIEQLRRSFELTRGNGWRILLMLVILYVTAQIVSGVLTTMIGLVAVFLLPEDLAGLLVSIVGGLVTATLVAFIALISAAIYRETAQAASNPWQAD